MKGCKSARAVNKKASAMTYNIWLRDLIDMVKESVPSHDFSEEDLVLEGVHHLVGICINEGILGDYFKFTVDVSKREKVSGNAWEHIDYNYCNSVDEMINWVVAILNTEKRDK